MLELQLPILHTPLHFVMPPSSFSLWQCARGTQTVSRGWHRTQLPLRTVSTASASRKVPSPSASKTHKPTPQSDRSDLPPESPKYVFIPNPPQPDRYVWRRMKGILPRPRDPFQRHKQRARLEELAAATPEPARRLGRAAENMSALERARLEAKASLAAQRRSLLRQGTAELRARANQEASVRRARSEANRKAATARLTKPENESERLTAPSIRHNARGAAVQPDPLADQKFALRQAKYDAMQSAKRARRTDALHTLYTKASTFVVDNEGLEKALEAAFDTPFYRANPDRGIWDQEGFPEGLDWLIAQQATSRAEYRAALGRSRDTRGIEPDDRTLRRGRERAERLAEALIGGDLGEGTEAEKEGKVKSEAERRTEGT